jgi:hypothetical protein
MSGFGIRHFQVESLTKEAHDLMQSKLGIALAAQIVRGG